MNFFLNKNRICYLYTLLGTKMDSYVFSVGWSKANRNKLVSSSGISCNVYSKVQVPGTIQFRKKIIVHIISTIRYTILFHYCTNFVPGYAGTCSVVRKILLFSSRNTLFLQTGKYLYTKQIFQFHFFDHFL
jgi:hypothetical protein